MNLIRILGDRHAGFILCLIVVLNLIVGSLVMNSHPNLYPKFFNLDLNYFFQPVRVEHSWLYALLVTFSLFGINLFACIIESVARLVANRGGRLKEISALLFHVALLATMVAHLYEGFYASTQQMPITAQGVSLPELGRVRVESLKNIYYPDGSLQDTEIALSFDKPDGQQISKIVAYNQPAIFDGGRRQVVMLGSEMVPAGVTIIREGDNREFRVEEGRPLALGNGSLMLQGIFETENGLPYAQFLWLSGSGSRQEHVMALVPGTRHSQIGIDGVTYRFDTVIEAPLLAAIIRYNPAIPLMIVSLVLAAIGTVLLIRWLARNRISRNRAGREALNQ